MCYIEHTVVQVDIIVVDREVRLERVSERRRLLVGVVSFVLGGSKLRDLHADRTIEGVHRQVIGLE